MYFRFFVQKLFVKFIRTLAFSLSMVIMMGHDLVPHFHEHRHNEKRAHHHHRHHDSHTNVHAGLDLDLSHALAHFQHNPSDKTLSPTIVKSSVERNNIICYITNGDTTEEGSPQEATLRTQRLWERTALALTFLRSSFSHRGPPLV